MMSSRVIVVSAALTVMGLISLCASAKNPMPLPKKIHMFEYPLGRFFLGIESVPQELRPEQLLRNAKSTRFFDGSDLETEEQVMKCSLVFISKNGHALTSKHCLNSVLHQKEIHTIGRMHLMATTKLISPKDLTIDQIFEKIDEALEASKKRVSFEILAFPKELGDINDFALLKLGFSNPECVSTSESENIVDGMPVHAISYPTAISSNPNFDFYNFVANPKVFTFGTIEKIRPDSYLNIYSYYTAEQIKAWSGYLTKYWQEIRANQDNPSNALLYHSVLLGIGSSGSGLFNAQGELIGLNKGQQLITSIPNFTGNGFEADFSPGSYISIPISIIKKYLENSLSKQAYEQAFNCK